MKNLTLLMTLLLSFLAPLQLSFSSPSDLTSEQKIKLEQRLLQLEKIAADPVLVAAVKERNTQTSEAYKQMTQEKWKSASILDPSVRSLAKNPVALILKQTQATDAALSEAFVSAADGTKVAFLSKPTSWSHKGNAKHDQAMQGKRWMGKVEVDESSGLRQIQVSVPILIDGKPAGSLVAGFQVLKL